MSIGLLVSYHDTRREDRWIPIASEDSFGHHWKPICAELNLRWIPRFQSGWMLSPQDLPYILDELGRLHRYLSCGQTHAEIRPRLMARINALIRELTEIQKMKDADAYVGCPCQPQRRPISFAALAPAAAQAL